MVVVEAFLTPLFEVVKEKLLVGPLLEYAGRLKLDTAPLKKWRGDMLLIQAVLHDAEQRQILDDGVEVWMDDLKSIASDIEDVLDEIHTEAKRCGFIQGPETSTGKIWKSIPCLDGSKMTFNLKMGEKMSTITRELDDIVARIPILRLRHGLDGLVSSVHIRDRQGERLTTSLVKESEVFGRDADKEKIIKLMFSDEVATARKVQVIPISGMGGVGKTTLARAIYNDKRVEEIFDCRVWVPVTHQFDLERVTAAISESVSKPSSGNSTTLQSLHESLQKNLKRKRFFLVLDDIWLHDPNTWSDLKAPLKDGAPGSVIMVTTRSERVASIERTTSIHPLRELTPEDSRSLFEHIAFEKITPHARRNLEPIALKIIAKCRGLPLALKTLAGLLRCNEDEKAWRKMLNDEIWDLPPQNSSILPVLHLSYRYLPSKLKPCFAYCSIFPKNYEFKKEELILLWAAQGFLGGLKKGETIREVGETCFDELFSVSFLQQSSLSFQESGVSISSFVMHDLIHDLARYVSKNSCLILDEVEEQDKISERIRHVSYIREEFNISKRFAPLYRTDKLRTFLPLRKSRHVSTCYLADKVLFDLLPTFRCLRALSLSHYNITHLPDSTFGNLKLLRYLNLSDTKIQKLPVSICMLLNLQFLVLSKCLHLTELPVEIGNLVELIHLDISSTNIQEMPSGINRLKNLQRLTAFVVGEHGGAQISELRDLSRLQGALSILKMQNVVNAKDALEANLKKKEDLDCLEFAWDPNPIDSNSENQTRVLEVLQPHTKVKRLSIQHYYGVKFPKWLGDHSFVNLSSLRLSDCRSCSTLPPLGQLRSLKDLSIVRMDRVREIGAEFYGINGCGSYKPFGSLVSLSFEEMTEWEEWVCSEVEFACLKRLRILRCPKLRGDMPQYLPQLVHLEISYCEQLVCRLPIAPSIRQLMLRKCHDAVVRCASSLTSLTKLGLCNVCVIPKEFGQLHSLENLSVRDSPQLKEMPPILHNLRALKHLVISNCHRLFCLPEWGLPPLLEILEIRDCSILETIPEGMNQNSSRLQLLSIQGCGSLRSLPGEIVRSLNILSIIDCERLEMPVPEDMSRNYYASMEHLIVVNSCDSWTSFPLPFFTKLGILYIRGHGSLESVSISDALHPVNLTSLQVIFIESCPNLVAFPQRGIPAPNLKYLTIINCQKLKSLPQGMHALLTSLEQLTVQDCPEIDSFPEGGLPTSLSSLYIWNCNKLMARGMKQGLETLSSLDFLSVRGSTEERLETFSEEWLLPSTLPSLEIGCFPKLESLGNTGLQHLPFLKKLKINDCDELQSFPEPCLPSSLCLLYIRNCPLLKAECQRGKGKEWPRISHIPYIVFGKDIFQSSQPPYEEVILQ